MLTADIYKKLILYATLIGATLLVLLFSFNPTLLNLIRLERMSGWVDHLKAEEGSQVLANQSVFEEGLKPLYSEPARLYMREINVDIPLIEIGVEDDGTMEAPEDWNVGGWYAKSAKPGEIGNVIINAHYDNNFGAPAAFYELKNAKINDRVFIVDSLGKVYTYRITNLFYIDILDPERLKVFEDVHDKSELTLITCGGVWIPGEGYSKRLVAKAELFDH